MRRFAFVSHSIRLKMTILLLVITIIPFGSSIVFTYYATKESIKDQTLQQNQQLLIQGKNNLEGYLDVIKQLSVSIYNNSRFINLLKGNGTIDYYQNSEITGTLSSLYNFQNGIEQIFLYSTNMGRVFSISKLFIFNAKPLDIQKQPLFSEIDQAPNQVLIQPVHYLNDYGISGFPSVSNTLVFSYHRSILDYPNKELLGYLSIDLNLDKVRSICEKLYNRSHEEVYLLDQNGAMLYGPKDALIGQPFPEHLVSRIKQSPVSTGHIDSQFENMEGIILFEKLNESGWTIIKKISYDDLYAHARRVVLINSVIGICVLLLVVVATLYVSFKITNPIRILLKNITQIENGHFKVDFDSLGNDEIGILGSRFKSMIETIHHYINQEYRWKLQTQTSQLKVLQSQINPHFLHNALQSIGYLALQGGSKPIYKLLRSLSEIMRYSMNTNEDVVEISKELAHIESYLHLQKQRFGNRFTYELQVDHMLLNTIVPKMTLQPLVENYFKHGLHRVYGKGILRITIQRCEDMAEIVIEDNGGILDEDRLRSLRQLVNRGEVLVPSSEGEGIGLVNVASRLKLFFSGKSSFQIGNGLEGFKVIIQVPLTGKGERTDEDSISR